MTTGAGSASRQETDGEEASGGGLPTEVPEAFWRSLAAAPTRALLVDFDGTLAPFHADRHRAVPYPRARTALHDIMVAGRTRVVVVSGRRIADLPDRLGLSPVPELWGCHGFERRHADGRVELTPLDADATGRIARLEAWARARGHIERCEHKPSGVALHWRGLDAREASALRDEARAAWAEILAGGSLDLHAFDGGLEVRPRGFDKGRAVTAILAELGDDDAACAYLGDDRTDEDAFVALGDRGLAVLVREELRETAAGVWLRPPDELIAFLDRWAEIDRAA